MGLIIQAYWKLLKSGMAIKHNVRGCTSQLSSGRVLIVTFYLFAAGYYHQM